MINLSWFNIISYDIQKFNEDIASHLHGRLLDVGCGRKQQLFLDKVDEYIGLDKEETLKVNKERNNTKADIFGDATALPFPDNSFDCVTSLSLYEHLPEPQQAANEAYRVLKKGGMFALTFPFMNRLHTAPYDYYRYTEYGMRHILEKAGFKIVKIVDGGGMWKMIGARLAGYIYSDLLGIGYGESDRKVKPKKYLFPLFAPLIVFIVVMARFLDKVNCIKTDTIHYYFLCKK